LDEAGALLEIQFGTGEERVKSLGMTGSGRILVAPLRPAGNLDPTDYRVSRTSKSAAALLRAGGAMIRKRGIPKFKSEAEEAKWWDDHREETARWMQEAVAAGKTSTLSEVLRCARERACTAQTISIRIQPDDLSRAQSLAAKKGLDYEAYLGVLVHEALQREERLARRG
jgi:predicted DNA binding CopG/RHH family protein